LTIYTINGPLLIKKVQNAFCEVENESGYSQDRAGSGWEKVAGNCEWGNETSGSKICEEFLDLLKTC